MRYGNITGELSREPVEVGVLVGQSGVFIANHERRGVFIADKTHRIRLTTDEALTLLAWLQDQEPVLQAMIDEETAALATVEQRQ